MVGEHRHVREEDGEEDEEEEEVEEEGEEELCFAIDMCMWLNYSRCWVF